MDNDEVVVRYQGHELRKSDLEFLKGPCYVTDSMIDFYFHCLSKKFGTGDHILLVPPSISRWLSLCCKPDHAENFMGRLDLHSRDFVLFPVNNDEAMDGVEWTQPHTHWSLLVYDAPKGLFFHFDDVCEDMEINFKVAENFFEGVKAYVPWKEVEGEERPRPPEIKMVRTAELAKGFNKYDCGVHLMAMARMTIEWYVDLVERLGNGGRVGEKPIYVSLIHEMDVSVERNTETRYRGNTGEDYGKKL